MGSRVLVYLETLYPLCLDPGRSLHITVNTLTQYGNLSRCSQLVYFYLYPFGKRLGDVFVPVPEPHSYCNLDCFWLPFTPWSDGMIWHNSDVMYMYNGCICFLVQFSFFYFLFLLIYIRVYCIYHIVGLPTCRQ